MSGDQKQFVTQTSTVSSKELLNDMTMCIVVDGLPKIAGTVVPKLLKAVNNLFTQKGVPPKNMELVTDEIGSSVGYAFLEYATREEAENAIAVLNELPFDKAHRMKANSWGDFDTYLSAPDEYVEPKMEASSAGLALDNPCDWLRDPTGREQYLVKSGTNYDVSVFWNDPHLSMKRQVVLAAADAPSEWTVLDKQRHRVQKDFPTWSPLGTYILSMEASGVRLWAMREGKWTSLIRFDHSKISKFEMSPKERYALTACTTKCCLWDVRFGKLLKTFAIGVDDKHWPLFYWNHNETLLANQRKDVVYLMSTANLVPIAIKDDLKKDEKVVDPKAVPTAAAAEVSLPIVNFAWAPSLPILIRTSVPAAAGGAAKINVFEVTDEQNLKELSLRSVYNISDIDIAWQPKGLPDRLYCACLMRATGTKPDKIDLFKLGGKEVGIEQIEVTGNILSVAWDPSGLFGARFAVVSTAQKNAKRALNHINFYYASQGVCRVIKTLTDRTATQVLWSPSGTHVVARDERGALDFYLIEANNVTHLQSQEHVNHHNAAWDPSGRYFVTSTTVHKTEIDPGFRMYNFLGQLVFFSDVEKFSHLSWRPRPPTTLTSREQQDILKSLPKRIAKYEEDERQRRESDNRAAREAEESALSEFNDRLAAIRKAKAKDTEKRKNARAKLLGDGYYAPECSKEIVIHKRIVQKE
eukprot:PhF_6_TR11696/c0_g1_i1/m.18990/K03253/EIF3B; translation initiation factor 3 subunit B